MKKYKLIKEYPGSPKLGTEIINNENVNSAHTLDKTHYYNGYKIQEYPEFWEEVVEKDYEILSYISKLKDCIVEVNNEWLEHGDIDVGIIRKSFVKNMSYKYFSTKEAAEKYLAYNKPQYSLNDINEAAKLARIGSSYSSRILDKLREK